MRSADTRSALPAPVSVNDDVRDPAIEPRFQQLYEPLAPSTLATWGTRKQRAVTDGTGRRLRSSTTAEASPGTPLGDVWDIGIIAPRFTHLYDWSADVLALPGLRGLVDGETPTYAWDSKDDADVWDFKPSRLARLARRIVPVR